MIKQVLQICVLISIWTNSVFAEDFPGRTVYPGVEVYSTEQLEKSINDVNIVDVRSRYEYEVLHINSAHHISLNSKKFAADLEALKAKSQKPIVFYCNGHTCYKSYKAVVKAKASGIKNVFSYDSGIFDWATAHPDKTTMLSVSPINPEKLISKKRLNDHMLEPDAFNQKAGNTGEILDIREPRQRGLLSLYPYRQINISLQEKDKLSKFLTSIKKVKKPLFIYDQAGKQVRWLQYYIEASGIKNYYFLKGGAKAYLKKRIKS